MVISYVYLLTHFLVFYCILARIGVIRYDYAHRRFCMLPSMTLVQATLWSFIIKSYTVHVSIQYTGCSPSCLVVFWEKFQAVEISTRHSRLAQSCISL